MPKDLIIRKFKKDDYFSDFSDGRSNFKSDRKQDSKKKHRSDSPRKKGYDDFFKDDF